MQVKISLHEFNVTFSDLIDHEKYEAYPVQGVEGSWVIYKKEEELEEENL